jgi:small-conductance mechanosensitive channel
MVLLFKTVLVLLLLFIIVNLALAMFHMVREPSEGDEQPGMSRYLGRRVLLSALIVMLLIIALASGWLEPNPRPY